MPSLLAIAFNHLDVYWCSSLNDVCVNPNISSMCTILPCNGRSGTNFSIERGGEIVCRLSIEYYHTRMSLPFIHFNHQTIILIEEGYNSAFYTFDIGFTVSDIYKVNIGRHVPIKQHSLLVLIVSFLFWVININILHVTVVSQLVNHASKFYSIVLKCYFLIIFPFINQWIMYLQIMKTEYCWLPSTSIS